MEAFVLGKTTPTKPCKCCRHETRLEKQQRKAEAKQQAVLKKEPKKVNRQLPIVWRPQNSPYGPAGPSPCPYPRPSPYSSGPPPYSRDWVPEQQSWDQNSVCNNEGLPPPYESTEARPRSSPLMLTSAPAPAPAPEPAPRLRHSTPQAKKASLTKAKEAFSSILGSAGRLLSKEI